jgi:hypothetical protein
MLVYFALVFQDPLNGDTPLLDDSFVVIPSTQALFPFSFPSLSNRLPMQWEPVCSNSLILAPASSRALAMASPSSQSGSALLTTMRNLVESSCQDDEPLLGTSLIGSINRLVDGFWFHLELFHKVSLESLFNTWSIVM